MGKDILKAATDLNPLHTPENLVKLADAVGNTVTVDAKHALDVIEHPPTPSVTINSNTTVVPTPIGPQVNTRIGGTPIQINPLLPIPIPGGIHLPHLF